MQEPGVQNVTVKTVTFRNTQNGFEDKDLGKAMDLLRGSFSKMQ